LVLLFGGRYVVNKEMTVGELTSFVQYSMNIVWPMEMLGWLTNCYSSARASNKKLKKIFNEKPSIKDASKLSLVDDIEGSIKFENVSFEKDDTPILDGISFEVKKGATLGIMGATGSGKTSIVNLLQRMYDVSDGVIKIDNIDIRKMPLNKVRTAVGYVMQDTFLFSDTIRENVSLGKKCEISNKSITDALEDASASSFVEKMEDGFDTVIGERGVGLSGGQKQRLSIARALAKNNPILVLDDSTSALDMETEHEIQKMLEDKKDVTKIVVAHRISSVRYADEIIVLDDGKIIQKGRHEELMKDKDGAYYDTYMSQYGDYYELAKEVG